MHNRASQVKVAKFPKVRLGSHLQPVYKGLCIFMLLFTFSRSQIYERHELNAFDLCLNINDMSASFDLSISALVLILDISSLTGCHANRGEPTNEFSVYIVISGHEVM